MESCKPPVTVLQLAGNGVSVPDHEGSWPAVPASVSRARAAVAAWASDAGLSGSLVHNIKVVVSEATTNAVMHAYEGLIPADFSVTASLADDFVEVVVRDRGRGMVQRADTPGMGLGMPLIANLADHLEVQTLDEGGTEVRMRFGVQAACGA